MISLASIFGGASAYGGALNSQYFKYLGARIQNISYSDY